jgi:hypothetical protein
MIERDRVTVEIHKKVSRISIWIVEPAYLIS